MSLAGFCKMAEPPQGSFVGTAGSTVYWLPAPGHAGCSTGSRSRYTGSFPATCRLPRDAVGGGVSSDSAQSIFNRCVFHLTHGPRLRRRADVPRPVADDVAQG